MECERPPRSGLPPRSARLLTPLSFASRFLFINLHLTKDGSQGDSSQLISTTAVEKGILGVPGVGFSPSGQVSSFVRVSFSLTSEEEAEEGMRRLAECVREARGE